MYKRLALATLVSTSLLMTAPAAAQSKSSGRKAQESAQSGIPVCSKSLGTIAVVEPDDQWWQRYKLRSPESILKLIVARSGCFSLVDRNKGLNSRALERALADNDELQEGSNIGSRQVKAADYFIIPDLVNGNENSGGNSIGGAVGGLLGGGIGGLLGRVKVNKKEANVTLSLVNSRTTEMEVISEGYYRKSDLSVRGGGGGWTGGLAGALGGSGYEKTAIGQVIVLAYLEAYRDMVGRLGGLPDNASLAAPQTPDEYPAAQGYGVTASAYDQIANDMTLQQIEQIIGFAGDEQSAGGGIATYRWQNGSSGPFIVGTFSNGRLVAKGEGGL